MKQLHYFIFTKSYGLYLNILVLFSPKKAQTLAFKLFSNPRAGRLDINNIPDYLKNNLFETLYYKNHAFQTYKWHGNDEIVLLVHGWESNSSRWEKLHKHLSKTKKTIIAIDAPAHGLSAGKEFNVPLHSEFLKIAIEKYKPSKIIAHSIGGAATLYSQYKYPNPCVKKMVLMSAPSDIHIIIKNYVNLLWLNSKNQKLLHDYFRTHFNVELNTFSGGKYAENIDIETMIVHDKNDKIVLFDEALKLKKGFKNQIFIETNELGHSLQNESLFKDIINFIDDKPLIPHEIIDLIKN